MMGKKLDISFDSDLIDQIASDFDLRAPNREALRKLIFTLDGDYDPDVMQVINLATGVGKTYLMAAFIEYIRRQGVKNVVIVTPGKIVQRKTVHNFIPGDPHYIEGAMIPPDVVTPQDYTNWVSRVSGGPKLIFGSEIPMLAFIFNIQQLIAPGNPDGDTHGASPDAERRKPRRFDENAGVLFDYLKNQENLVVIADESHLYSTSAAAFHAALKELAPAATVGLTASVLPEDHVIHEYPLYRAIQDEYVKAPVLAFRKGGYGLDAASEEQQLRDALRLRELKQVYYDAYAEQQNLAHLNAVLFVVCSDVDHATQTADLLRAPEFFGKQLAILQVDSKHDDESTQKLLENLDRPDSPVLAVVSVNKLKEGWDVRNIAVVVTLRAMASEVLTEQTMGRGLRLPFGKYTHIWQIDQLDIISHQSFQELLSAENVLRQFGLEEAVSQGNRDQVNAEIRKAAKTATANTHNPEAEGFSESNVELKEPLHGNTVNDSGNGVDVRSDSSGTGTADEKYEYGPGTTGDNDPDSRPTVGVRTIGDDGPVHDEDLSLTPVTIEPNPRFAGISYKFPVTQVRMEQPALNLADIEDSEIVDAAHRVTNTGDVLYRKEIIAAMGSKLKAVDAESAEVDSVKVEDDVARLTLIKLVTDMQAVPSTARTIRYVSGFLVPKFMKNVNFDGWTMKSLDSARTQLLQLIREYMEGVQRAMKEVPEIHPRNMSVNGYMLPLGTKIYEPIESREQFVRGRVYSGWFKSLYTEESFDSYSGEYELARLLNTSPHITWWHRLHTYYGAFIYYNAKDRYFPDFVAMDDEGVYWIIEGKDKRGRDDRKVRDKRKAAESLVRRLVAVDEYMGQKWGYLIAYEDDISRSDSWNDLKAVAQPVTNTV